MDNTHLDRDVLSALQEVMEDGYPELLDTFLSDSEERLSLLRKADDADRLGATAHSFKGSSSNMGATRLAELCHELEQRAKEKKLEGIEALVGEIDGEFAIVRPLFEAERQRSLAE
ncbi:HPt (histidine-containing phosphotransfer) domain-containing protein [Pseudomonas sp. PvR086]|uniref:Hpt domain-containing protein n=1 Tax=Pseudomonas TaxID=286 RepID=UPI00036935C4|nr:MULTISPECIES: Hpt domain-containing protein [Pseudomonas]ANI61775.1 sensor histidine kinase [Pseudomonas sp. GR 6-02]MBD9608087.1 Hpt domain-containing protein [Pseudomonas sp. PDM08]MBD9618954.1 Hpt domain-containing protein [Pseudomonas sp. PDM07]MDR7109056.1 HPt (histidine-containing phosphotransfer) domain-containing protein [Pseudomonas frederiksbergensis]PMY56891.1 Hpt domain-containing protein [Pseudomonas sp. FW305-53]